MNRNQKIALGCGGAGCLGLLVVAIAACALYFLVWRSPARRRLDYNYNISTNRNSNSNDNSDFTANTNDNDNSSNSNSSSSSASTIGEDDKHKLYQAAMITGDSEVLRRVSVKIGIMDEDFTPGRDHEKFVEEHVSWVLTNTDFIQSINSEEKARAYIQTHLPD
jgi:hypothetical protein